MKRFAIAAAVAAAVWAADPAMGAEKQVVRFVSAQQGNHFGPALTITYTPADSNVKATIGVPNKNPMGGKYDPPEFVVKIVEGLKPGDYLSVEIYTPPCGNTFLRSISRYDLKPGEDELGVFVFSSTSEQVVQGKKMVVLEASRFGKSYSFLAGPAAVGKDASGVVEDLKAFSKGDLIEIIPTTSTSMTIKNVYKFTPSQTGELVKSELREVSEQKFHVVELKIKDTTVVYQVPNVGAAASQKPQPDLLAKLGKLKAGSMVTARVRQIGETLWLVDIKPANVEKTASAAGQKTAIKG